MLQGSRRLWYGPGWRWVFLINVPIVLVAGAVAVWIVRESDELTDRRLDLPGMAFGALLLAAVTFAFVEAGSGLPVVLAAGLAVAALAALLAAERAEPDPMLPVALFRRPDFATANAAAGVMNLDTHKDLTRYLQRVQDRSATNNTARQAGGAIGIAAFGALAGNPRPRRLRHRPAHRRPRHRRSVRRRRGEHTRAC